MRSLKKGPIPRILLTRGQEWTQTYIAATGSNSKPGTPWRHTEIREALARETDRRCAYCDSYIRSVAYDQIEHILPRSKRPELVVDWDNLTLACPRCNNQKRDYYSPMTPLINPYIDDPDTHLLFLGNLVLAIPGNPRAQVTVLRLGLHRADLAEARTRRIEYVASLVDNWINATGSEIKDTLAEFIREDLVTGEYYKTVVAYLRAVGFPIEGEANDLTH